MEEETTFKEQGHSFASPLGQNPFNCNQAQDRRSATAISQQKRYIEKQYGRQNYIHDCVCVRFLLAPIYAIKFDCVCLQSL